MKRVLLALSVGVAVLLAACGGSTTGNNPATGGSGVPTPSQASLIGTGATFPAPFYDAARFAYNQKFSQATINYNALGSGAGIFLGTIKNWNDPALAADNSGVSLPSQAISVVHRSDGSGTTYIFTDYLSTISTDWKGKVGKGKSVSWPVGQGAKGNEAVATTIKQTPGAIGYVELAYVIQTNMTQASLQNHDGNIVIPSPDGATAAASQFLAISPTQFSIVDAPGKTSAPISGYSWLMLYKDQADKNKGTALVDFLDWLVTDGQQYAVNVHYAKLPSNIVNDDINSLKTVTSGGSTLLNVPAPS